MWNYCKRCDTASAKGTALQRRDNMSQSSQSIIQMAKTFDDRRDAFRVVHGAYVRAGLSDVLKHDVRITKHQLLPQSRIFVTKVDNEVVSTLSMFPDGEHGLPLEEIYPLEVTILRNRGMNLAEVGCFADKRQHPRRFIDNFCHMTNFMAQYAFQQGIDGFIIAVHPRHAKFYSKFLCFKEIGGQVSYPQVNNRPAVALLLDFGCAEIESPEKFELFFGKRVSPEEFANGEMPRNEIEFFAKFIPPSSINPVYTSPHNPMEIAAVLQ